MRWLQSLDENPAPLHDWLRSQRNVRRLGFYFAALLEYWIRFCPFLGNPTVLAGQQVHAGIDGQCAGQLKLVFERDETELVHWESHVKFFAFCPNEDGGDEEAEGEADAEDDVVSATASEASASTTSVDATATTTSTSAAEQPAWVPPPRELCARWQRKDRLQAWDKLQAWPDDAGLATYVGPFLGENLLHRVVELRRKLSLSDAPAVRSFLSAHFPQASEPRTVKAESVIRGYLFYPLGADGDGGCGAISANHSRGWWTRSLESLLSSTEPASMWALPGNGAGVREDAVGALGGKLHWLSPAIAFESRGRLRIGGIPSLGVEDSEVLTADELREALLVQSDTAKLLLQLLPSSDADADGGGRVWVEASRGFLMPTGWDPTPLRRAQPLGLRSGMRQKQSKRGGVVETSDYREAEGSFAVAPGMLAVRCGSEGGYGPLKEDGDDDDEEEVDVVACTKEPSFGDDALAEAAVADVSASWKKLAVPLHDRLSELSLATLAACKACEEKEHDDLGEEQVARFGAAVKSLFASTDMPPSNAGNSNGKGGGKGSKGGTSRGGAANSRFALAKMILARSIAHSSRVCGAVSLLRLVLLSSEQQRLLGSLLMAGLASSGTLQKLDDDDGEVLTEDQVKAVKAVAQLTAVFKSMLAGHRLPRLRSIFGDKLPGWAAYEFNNALIMEAITLFEVRCDEEQQQQQSSSSSGGGECSVSIAELPEGAVVTWPPTLPLSAITEYVQSLMKAAEEDDEEGTDALGAAARNASQFLRQLKVLHLELLDNEMMLRRLVDTNQWVHAEQLATGVWEEAKEARSKEEVVEEEEAAASDDKECYMELQKAAKAATVATVTHDESTSNESVAKVAAALGGYLKPAEEPAARYIKRSERLPIEGKYDVRAYMSSGGPPTLPPPPTTAFDGHLHKYDVKAYIESGPPPTPPTPKQRGLSFDEAPSWMMRGTPTSLPNSLREDVLSNGGGGGLLNGSGQVHAEDQKLLRLLLNLAHQRSNKKLVAKLNRIVVTEDGENGGAGGARASRASQLARLVQHNEIVLAVTFAGTERSLQIHLVKLLLSSNQYETASEVVRARHLPPSLLNGTPTRHKEEEEKVQISDGGVEEHTNGGCITAAPRLSAYALPTDALVECFDVAVKEEAMAAEAALARMHSTVTARGDALPAIGLDAEWVAGNKVALVQLAVKGHCALLRLHGLDEGASLPPSLLLLLEERSILKLGVGIQQDLKLLYTQYGLSSYGVLDLQALASRDGYTGCGLQRLTAEVLAKHLDKSPRLRCGNWEAVELSEAQILYAAMDAYVALDIFSRLYDGYLARIGGGGAAMEPLSWCAALVDADQSSKRDKSKKGIKQQQQPAAPVVDAAAATEDDDASRDPTPPPSGLGAEEQRPKSWIDPHLRETTAEAATDTIPPLDSTDLITRLTSSLNIDPTSAYLVSAAIAEADDDTLPVKSLALLRRAARRSPSYQRIRSSTPSSSQGI